MPKQPAHFLFSNTFPGALTGVIALSFLFLVTSSFAGTLIRSGGSTTVLPVVSKAAARYNGLNPEVQVTVSGGGSGVGIQGAGSGLLDIGLASREMTPEEVKKFKQQGLKVHVIGRDAVACVVSSEIYKAGVTALTREQIRAIYEGRIRNWQDVGGPDSRIVVIDKERHRGTRHVFMNYIFGNPKARARGVRLVTGSNNEEQAKIAQSNAAIGMLSFAWMNEEVRGLDLIEGDRIIQPTQDNVENGTYPIVRNLNMLLSEKANLESRKFLEFVLSESGQSIVADLHYIPARKTEGSHLAGKVPGL
ncbi:MAG: phosphate ABC transporter substrate-binding protein [Candidatus Nitronauta litoralis]|uniref:Phosphate ABC transporter substrate-binding protein n=1 Tax=Candidatus Nitronauta litoralis TaxID=2705533 RepID=A0A7T0BWF4_9BACT|nr:MAG: phosphate ABC transporter substrate-binding protein [Candidatus Nitronauta litoralis]